MFRRVVNFLADVGTIFISYVLAVFIRYHLMEAAPGINTLSAPYLLIAAAYSLIIASVLHYAKKDVVAINAIGCLFFLAFLYTIGELYFSRLALVLFWVISSVLLGVKSLVAGVIRNKRSLRLTSKKRILVVGGGEATNQFVRSVSFDSAYGYKIIGYVGKIYGIFYTTDFEVDNEDIELRGFLGEFEKLGECVDKYAPDEIVFALENEEMHRLGEMIDTVSNRGVRVSVVPSFDKYIPEGTRARKIDKTVVFDLNTKEERKDFGIFGLGLSLATVFLLLMLIVKRFHVGYLNTLQIYEGYRSFVFAIAASFGYQIIGSGKKGIKKSVLLAVITVVFSIAIICAYEVLYTQGVDLGKNIINDMLITLAVLGFSVIVKIILDSVTRSDVWYI